MGSTIYLENDYYYDEGFSTDGILIENEGLTIDGKGHTLNGMSKSRIFHFYSSSSSNHNAVLKNITFYNGYTESDGGALYPETNYYKRSEFDSWGEACYWNLEVNNLISDFHLILSKEILIHGDGNSQLTMIRHGKMLSNLDKVSCMAWALAMTGYFVREIFL